MTIAACIGVIAVVAVVLSYGYYSGQRRRAARRSEPVIAQPAPREESQRRDPRPDSESRRSLDWQEQAQTTVPAASVTPPSEDGASTAVERKAESIPVADAEKPIEKPPAKAIWRAGILNGLPKGPDDPHLATEFGVHSSDETPLDVRTPAEFPQVIKAGQSVILRLDKLPQETLTLRMVINTGKARPHCYPWMGVKHPAFLQVLLNDEIIYYRWLAVSSNWLTIRLPERLLQQGQNKLVLRNIAGADWGVDSVWIEKPVATGKVWLALSEAEWLDEKRARHIPFMGLSCYPNLPNSPDEELIRLRALPPVKLKSLSKRRQRWRDEKWGQRDPSEFFPDDWFQKYFKDWRGRIDNILMRGGEPVIHITTGTHLKQGWLRLFALFRPFVRHWILDCHSVKGADEFVAYLKQSSPDIDIRIAYRGKETMSRSLLAETGVCLPAMNVRPMDETLAQHRRSLVSRKMFDERVLSPILISRFLTGVRGLERNARGSLDIARMTVTWLHEGGGPVYMYGGRVGSGVFPERASEPAFVWDMLRPLLPLARGDGRRLVANVVPYDSNVGLFDAAWCAVRNSRSQVSMLVFADTDKNRSVTVECPVPWQKGKTIIEFQSVQLDEKKVPVTGEATTQTVDTVTDGKQGVVRFRHRLSSLTLIRIRSAARSKFLRQPIIESLATDRAVPSFTKDLFRLSNERVLTGRWVDPLYAEGGRRLAGVIDPATKFEDCVASLGKVGQEEQTVPWNDRSSLLTFSSDGADAARPKGVRIFMDRGKYKSATHLEIWVMPRSSSKAKSVTLVAGTWHVRSRIRLQVDKWQCLRVPFTQLVRPGWDKGFNLRVWPYTEDSRNGATVSFEFNAFHAVGIRPAPDQSPDRQAQIFEVATDKGNSDYLLLAKPGKPAQANLRLKKAITAKSLVGNTENTKIRLFSKARILQVTTAAMPKQTKLPDKLLDGLPPAMRTRLRNGALSAIHVGIVRE